MVHQRSIRDREDFMLDIDLLKTYEEIRRATDLTVKLSNDEVDKIVVAALLDKYQGQVRSNDEKHAEMFKEVLRFYLTEQELTELLPYA